jgi:Cupin
MKLAEIDKDADLLTTVLNVLQFKGRCFCYSQFTAPWALKLPESDFAHFHVCEGGQAWIEVEGVERPALMAAGDLVIRPHGNAHVIQDDPKSIALNHLLKWRSPGTNLVRHGGGGTETIGVCGSFKFENEVGNPIISLLPKLIHVSHKDTQTCIWLEPILKGLAHEGVALKDEGRPQEPGTLTKNLLLPPEATLHRPNIVSDC